MWAPQPLPGVRIWSLISLHSELSEIPIAIQAFSGFLVATTCLTLCSGNRTSVVTPSVSSQVHHSLTAHERRTPDRPVNKLTGPTAAHDARTRLTCA